MKQSLYQISTEMQSLLEEITQAEGELTPEIEEKIALVTSQLTTKTDDVVSWVNYQEDLIGLANARINELKAFIEGVEKGLGKFDGYVNNCLVNLGTNKIEGKFYAITRRKPVQVVNVFDETLIPMDFIKIPEPKPAIQKAEIGAALKKGIEVPGAKLTESTNVSISYKMKK
jgi:hypothetical protein